MGLEERVH